MTTPVPSDQWRECAECGQRWLGGHEHCCRCVQSTVDRLTRERDQYKQIAELNAETIKAMCAENSRGL